MTGGNENFICGPLVPEDRRSAIGWQYVPREAFVYTANALRSVAHVIGFDVKPLYLECGSSLDDTDRELSRRLIIRAYEEINPVDEIPERRRFFMRLVGRDPHKTRFPLTFPTRFEASRGAAAERWAVSAPDSISVVKAAETLIDFAGPGAESFAELLRRESPRFAEDRVLETIQAAIIRPSGYIHKLLCVARTTADYGTYFLSWWG